MINVHFVDIHSEATLSVMIFLVQAYLLLFGEIVRQEIVEWKDSFVSCYAWGGALAE